MDKVDRILGFLFLAIIAFAICYAIYSSMMVMQMEKQKAQEFKTNASSITSDRVWDAKEKAYTQECLLGEKINHPSTPENITKQYCKAVTIGKLLSDLR